MATGERKVFAHYMVGLTYNQDLARWQKDINDAHAVGIDGFALNFGPNDPWTMTQLYQVYAAAEAVPGFSLFMSFDFLAGSWSAQQIITLVNTFKGHRAQHTVNGLPVVSTFEGPSWAENWPAVREGTGGIYLMPAWTSLGAYGLSAKLPLIDGFFSWNAWPQPGQQAMTSADDQQYRNALAGKPYMMGVSPYFYTNLPEYGKNWYSSSESLWYDRWQQVLDVGPEMVEIITWNDFGESSYICDAVPEQIIPGAMRYASGIHHDALRAMLPYFIAAYKAGRRDIVPPGGDTAVAWYRTNPVTGMGNDGGTIWGQGGGISAKQGARDVVSVVTITTGSTTVHVKIGDAVQSFSTANCSTAPACYFEMPFNGRTGPVTLSMGSKTVTGPSINPCSVGSQLNFNPVAIRL